jgi:hypothetical protein
MLYRDRAMVEEAIITEAISTTMEILVEVATFVATSVAICGLVAIIIKL